MPNHDYWASFFHRAAKEEIGLVIEFDSEVTDYIKNDNIDRSRPPGFEDYTICIPSIPNTIYIIKPGVTLD